MKFVAVLLLAALCAVAAQPLDSKIEIEDRGIKESIINKANAIKASVSSALNKAKGKVNEFVKAVGAQVPAVLEQLKQLKDRLQEEAKKQLEIVIQEAIEEAKKEAAKQALAQITESLFGLGQVSGQVQNFEMEF